MNPMYINYKHSKHLIRQQITRYLNCKHSCFCRKEFHPGFTCLGPTGPAFCKHFSSAVQRHNTAGKMFLIFLIFTEQYIVQCPTGPLPSSIALYQCVCLITETQKVQTFRSAEFHAQKLSGKSA